MNVIHVDEVAKIENASALFTAPVTLQTVVSGQDGDNNVIYVNFPEGVANKFHTHNHDQILIVTEDKGFIETKEERIEITIGDVVLVKAGEVYKHGAIPGSTMTHISITAPQTSIDQIEP